MRVPESTVRGIIDRDPELAAVYGTTGKLLKARLPQAPGPNDVLDREPDDLPPGVGSETKAAVEIFELVSQAERELHYRGLKAIGVNETTLQKLRDLDGLASSNAAFIAIGLEKTHRLYYEVVINLKTVADQIKERYLDPEKAVDMETLPFFYRNYIDAVKEFGRAYDLFIQGAAVILKMVGGGGDEQHKPKKVKLGFTGRSMKQTGPAPVAAPPNG